jgi:hypothetical protein
MFKNTPPKPDINLLDLIPERMFGDSTNEEGNIVVDMPRFHIPWMQRYLVPKRKDPFIKIKLDRFGSRVWLRCDGAANVNEIADALVAEFGDEVQPVHERLGVFFRLLKQRGFVRLRKADGSFV